MLRKIGFILFGIAGLMPFIILVLLLLAGGCARQLRMPAPSPVSPVVSKQTCDHCGATFEVYSTKDPEKIYPPTVEWCFYDGNYCETGLRLLLSTADMSERYSEMILYVHARDCFGCRAATHTPESWAAAVEKHKNDPLSDGDLKEVINDLIKEVKGNNDIKSTGFKPTAARTGGDIDKARDARSCGCK